jgi:hypothetical protein
MKSTSRVLHPQGPFLQTWNKIFMISCLVSVSVDSLFFCSPAVDDGNNCLYLDDKLEKVASILRSHGYLLFTPRDISLQDRLHCFLFKRIWSRRIG